MDDAKLKSAVETLLAKYPSEAVAVYLNAFNDMNETSWANLKTILESDPRLQFGANV
jgi:NADPH-dependent 7-cyano-7-deazaguanine reductase QueF-like protein